MFDSGLVYTIDDSTPVYRSTCSSSDFAYHMGAIGLQIGAQIGVFAAFQVL